MFAKQEQELIKLQDQLDRERELLERARKLEDSHAEPAQKPFCMVDLYATIPGCDISSYRIGAHRS